MNDVAAGLEQELKRNLELDAWDAALCKNILEKENELVKGIIKTSSQVFDEQIASLFHPFSTAIMPQPFAEEGFAAKPITFLTWEKAVALISKTDIRSWPSQVTYAHIPIINASKKSYEDDLDKGMAPIPDKWIYFTRGGLSSIGKIIPSESLQREWCGYVFTVGWEIRLSGTFSLRDGKG